MGQVLLDQEDVTAYPMYMRAQRGISYLPQDPSIFRKLTVEENILAVLEPQKIPQKTKINRVRSLLNEFNIEHIRNAKGFTLSGGERRRVEISRALATSPSFILLDEPFAGIDPIAVSDIQSIVQKLKIKGIGVLITDHNVRETLRITDRAYVISEGKIIAAGDPDTVANNPKVRQTYLGEEFTF